MWDEFWELDNKFGAKILIFFITLKSYCALLKYKYEEIYKFFALKNNSIIVNQMRNDHKFPTEETG